MQFFTLCRGLCKIQSSLKNVKRLLRQLWQLWPVPASAAKCCKRCRDCGSGRSRGQQGLKAKAKASCGRTGKQTSLRLWQDSSTPTHTPWHTHTHTGREHALDDNNPDLLRHLNPTNHTKNYADPATETPEPPWISQPRTQRTQDALRGCRSNCYSQL